MPLKDLQQRLQEVGRIRLGATEERSRDGRTFSIPKKLDKWRLTSKYEHLLDQAAALYGGEVAEWREGEWELFTETDSLEIMLLPGFALSQWWELWGQRAARKPVECLRRCDGITEQLTDSPCLCAAEFGGYDERREAANGGNACKPVTRLSVLLPDVPGIGHWRLESHGYYAATELAGTVGVLEQALAMGTMLPAVLRIEHRQDVRDGQTRKYPVPVIDIQAKARELHELSAPRPTIPTGRQPQAAIGPATDFQVEDVTDVEAQVEEVEQAEPCITQAQRKKLFGKAKELGLSEGDVKVVVTTITGQDSTKGIPRSQFEAVLAGLDEYAQGETVRDDNGGSF